MVCFILFFRAIYKVLCDDLKLFMERSGYYRWYLFVYQEKR